MKISSYENIFIWEKLHTMTVAYENNLLLLLETVRV